MGVKRVETVSWEDEDGDTVELTWAPGLGMFKLTVTNEDDGVSIAFDDSDLVAWVDEVVLPTYRAAKARVAERTGSQP